MISSKTWTSMITLQYLSGSKRIRKFLLDSILLLLISSRERTKTGKTDSALRLDLLVLQIFTSNMNKIWSNLSRNLQNMNKSRNKARVEIIKEIITTNINRLMFLLTHRKIESQLKQTENTTKRVVLSELRNSGDTLISKSSYKKTTLSKMLLTILSSYVKNVSLRFSVKFFWKLFMIAMLFTKKTVSLLLVKQLASWNQTNSSMLFLSDSIEAKMKLLTSLFSLISFLNYSFTSTEKVKSNSQVFKLDLNQSTMILIRKMFSLSTKPSSKNAFRSLK